ncbi:MAG: penicillin-binding transpeptidase domain-containing protein [Sulfurospirillaceae bacterium]|nr:penicillin-binding transpeptidase domain-containing protein [Sulfurospirillaceae bacterium]MDD2826170.1 penicillin-binding transpeptidase domain-containing protein [Sulfurospirillaceae bacterium]
MMKIIFIVILCSTIGFSTEPNFGTYEGTAVILDVNSSQEEIYGTFATERLNPCSTFKILNSLIALDTHVIKDENEIIPWDKQIRRYDFWNKDHSMRSAIAVSTVWFYQELARRIGAERMQAWVEKANYGNHDTAKTLIDFWLSDGSLKISAQEQVIFLAKLMENSLPFSQHAMTIVKEIIILEKTEKSTFAGKTGSCGGIGWFVGFVEEPQSTRVFAFTLKGTGASGAEAKRIAKDYFQK